MKIAALNVKFVTGESRKLAESGMTIRETLELQPGWVLKRVGHVRVHQRQVPEDENFWSSWWMLSHDCERIYATNHNDPAWAARLKCAIAEVWGGDCRVEVTAKTKCRLLAWRGPGRPINKEGKALFHGDPSAMWVPDPIITQIYVPGMKHLWSSALHERSVVPFLVRGERDVLGREYGTGDSKRDSPRRAHE